MSKVLYKTFITQLWPWTFTVIVSGLILWLTLGNPPTPDESIILWEHTDKVVHACMFGGLFYATAFDWYRKHAAVKPYIGNIVMWKIALFCILFGGAIEIIQPSFSRSADVMDFMADVVGIIIAWIVSPFFIPRFDK